MQAGTRVIIGLMLGICLGCANFGGTTCPSGAVPREDVLEGNLSVRWCGAPDGNDPIGAVEYSRSGKPIVRGEIDEDGMRTGEWSLLDDNGVSIGGGRYNNGAPTGSWRFPDGVERRWLDKEYRFEPEGPFALIFDQHLESSDRPDEWRFEVVDMDLERGRIAYKVIWTVYEPSEGAQPCAYPGLDSPLAGVRLGLLEPGALAPSTLWDVYRPSGSGECSSEQEAKAALEAAKTAFKAEGLDPARKLEIERGSGSEVPWKATVGAHKLWFDKKDPPSLPWELQVPALVGRAGINDSMNGRTQYYELRVDGRPAARFALADSGSQAMAMLSVVGLLVDGDRASLVVEVIVGPSGSCCASKHDIATPVFSLSQPIDPW